MKKFFTPFHNDGHGYVKNYIARSVLIISAISVIGMMSSTDLFGQNGMLIDPSGPGTIDNSAVLEMRSTTQGVLVPRMTQTQRNSIANPATSLMIYQTDNTQGYYYNSGTPGTPIWKKVIIDDDLPSGNDFIVNGTTLQTSADFNIDGEGTMSDLNLTGNDINSTGILRIGSTTNVRVLLDVGGGGSNEFQVTANGSSTPVFSVSEAGNVDADGHGDFGGYGSFNGNLTLVGNSRDLIAADNFDITGTSGVDVVIDSDNSSTNTSFRILKDAGVDLMEVQEDGDVIIPDLGAGSGNGAIIRSNTTGQLDILDFSGLGNEVLAGNATWVDALDLADDDWYVATTTDPSGDITDNIYTEGDVGIGSAFSSSAPENTLHIKADGNDQLLVEPASALTENATIRVRSHWNTNASTDVANLLFENWRSGNSTTYPMARIASSVSNTGEAGNLVFYTSPSGSTLNEGLRITPASNIVMSSLAGSGTRMVTANASGQLSSQAIPSAQTLSFSSPNLSISGGNSVNLSSLLDNTDSQTLSLSGNTLSISGGNSVSLASYLDNTDSQDLSSSSSGTNVTVNITGGTGTTFSVADNDNNSSNELQTLSQSGTTVTLSNGGGSISVADNDNNSSNEIQSLSLSGNTLSISGSNNVDLSGFNNSGTDDQNLTGATLTGTSLEIDIENGNSTTVNLSALVDDADADPSNEYQDLGSSASGTNRTITITNGTNTTINVADNDNNSSNEIQSLSLSGNTLSISSSNNVDLSAFNNSGTDDQTLAEVLTQGNSAGSNHINMNGEEIDNVRYVDITAGDNNGIRFWQSNSYAISMGNTSEYHYGPVSDYSIKMHMSSNAGRGWTWGIDGSAPIAGLSNTGNFTIAGKFNSNGIEESSDARLKKDIQPLKNALEKALQLEGVTYKWRKEEFPEKNFGDRTEFGVIAQEVEKIFPELVSTDNQGFKSVQYSHMVPVLLEAIKEQQELITKLNSTVQNLNSALEISNDQYTSLLSKMELYGAEIEAIRDQLDYTITKE